MLIQRLTQRRPAVALPRGRRTTLRRHASSSVDTGPSKAAKGAAEERAKAKLAKLRQARRKHAVMLRASGARSPAAAALCRALPLHAPRVCPREHSALLTGVLSHVSCRWARTQTPRLTVAGTYGWRGRRRRPRRRGAHDAPAGALTSVSRWSPLTREQHRRSNSTKGPRLTRREPDALAVSAPGAGPCATAERRGRAARPVLCGPRRGRPRASYPCEPRHRQRHRQRRPRRCRVWRGAAIRELLRRAGGGGGAR